MRALIFKCLTTPTKILNQRKEAELCTPVPSDCWWSGWALKKTRHSNKVEENQVGNPEKGWRELREKMTLGRAAMRVQAKGELMSWERKTRRMYRAGGQRGNGNQKGNACTCDGPIRTVPLTDRSSAVGCPHLLLPRKKTEEEEDPDFLGQAQSRP